MRAVGDTAFVLQLTTLELSEVVIGNDHPVDDVLVEGIVALLDLPGDRFDDLRGAVDVDVLDHVVRTALGLPVGLVTRAQGTVFAPGVVFEHLSLDQQFGHLDLPVRLAYVCIMH